MSQREKSTVTRRQFVAGASAAIAAPMFVPSSAFGANERITMGFIGVGKQNRGHLGRMAGGRDTEVLAVCDVDTTRRQNAKKIVMDKAKKLERKDGKGCDEYIDFREITSRKDIDAVFIGTPDHWHAIPIIEACKSGKDIYCEKPLTLTIHEAHQVVKAVRKYKRVLQTGSQQRSEGNFRYACELVRNGRIGTIKEVEVNVGKPSKWCDLKEEKTEPGLDWDRWLGPAPKRVYNSILSPRGNHNHYPAWRNYREYSGGMMTDWGAHHFDIAQWGIGMDGSGPDEIIPPEDPKKGKGVRYIYKKTPVGDNVTVIHGGGGGVTFKGEKGTIVVNRGRLKSDPESIIKEPIKDSEIHLYKSPGHHKDFLNCMRDRKDPICNVDVGAGSVTVCHLGNLAYWNGRPLKWDPKKWEFIDDKEANSWRDRERRGDFQLPKV